MNTRLSYRIRALTPLLIIVLLVLAVYFVFVNSKFHITGTNPKTSSVATISPFMKVNFNKQLSKSDLNVSSSPAIIRSYDVEGKTLVINLGTPLLAGKVYTISIGRIRDIKNNVITNKNLVFVPKVIPAQDLPKDQADAILKQQASHPKSRNDISFTGTDSLVKYGVSLTQVDDLKQAVFQFAPKTRTAAIDASSVKPVPHNPNSSAKFDTINFSIKLDSAAYAARIEYSDLTVLRLYLSDAGGKIVFDSGNVSLDY
jgi:hypothetical protein